MRGQWIWADEQVVQASAYILGIDIGVTSMDARKGEINVFRKNRFSGVDKKLAHPCMLMGKFINYFCEGEA